MSDASRPRRGFRIYSVLFGFILAAGLMLAIWFYTRPSADPVDPIGSIVTGFRAENSLTVFSAQVATVTTRTRQRLGGLLVNRQTTIVPATVEYRLDQRLLTPDRFRWNAEAQTMTLTLPGLTISRPNLDTSRGQFYRSGPPMTAALRDELARLGTGDAAREAVRQASSAPLQRLARDAARDAMTRNLLLPLRAAGFDRASVTVRFADEPGASEPSYLDASRPVRDVLRERGQERARTTPATTPSS